MTSRRQIAHGVLRTRLARRLPRGWIAGFAAAHGLATRTVGDARALRPLSVDHLLELCAALDLSAATGVPLQPGEARRRGPFDRRFLALAITLRMEQEHLSLRAASGQARLSAPTLCRARNGLAVGADSVLKLCAWLGLHPNALTAPDPWSQPVPRETGAETGQAA